MEKDKLSYEELENQIANLKMQSEILSLNSIIQNKEKGKRAAELTIANIELDFQNEEKVKRAAELIIANIELAFQNEEKKKRAAELTIANIELDFQNEEKVKRAAELIIANIELAFQNEEKKKRAAELINSNIKLAVKSKEKKKLEAELIIANLALVLQSELIISRKKAEESERNLQIKNEEFETTNEELRQTNDELLFEKEKVEESEKTYRMLFESINDAVYISEINDDGKTGKFIQVNDIACHRLGYSKKELLAKTPFDINSEKAKPKVALLTKNILEKKHAIVETEHVTKDGRIIPVEISTKVTQFENKTIFHSIARDITERKKAENLLREKDIQFRKLSANVHDLIFQFTRKLDGTYCVPIASEGIKNIFGCSPEDVLEDFTPIARVIFPEDAARVMNDIEYSAEHLSYFTCEFRVQIPGKPIQWIYSRSTPEKLHDGSITWYGFTANITERKQAELLIQEKTYEIEASNEEYKQLNEELQNAKEKAEESEKLKSSFLQNMSHEIRTPLNAIVGFSHMITKPNQPPEKLEKFADLISESSSKLIEIITDIIEISQIESRLIKAELAEIDFISFIKNLVNSFSAKAEQKNIQLQLNMKIPFMEYEMLTDIDKLNKTLRHVIDNAFKFTAKGSVEIDCNLVETHGRAYLQIAITDTGIGISQEMQNIIFEPFRQAENSASRDYGGNGLGLSIAKAYIKLLNGSISVKSELGKGTTVGISIPVNKLSRQITQKEVVKQACSINTILIAEDEYSNFQYLLELLGEASINILHAANGKEAVEMCKNNSSIDLVLMDIKMPIMDGFTAAKLIKAFKPKLPVIAQTAFALDSEKEQFKGIFDDYITKPIDEDVFKLKLGKYIS